MDSAAWNVRCRLRPTRGCAARASGDAANQMLMVALGWQMYDLTGCAWDLGLVELAQFLPALLLAGSLVLQLVAAACLALASAGGWVSPTLIL